MIKGRDSRGRFAKGNVPCNKKVDISQREVTAFVGHKKLIDEGVLKLERVQVICSACGQRVEAVVTDGRVKGYCAVAKQFVDFPIETQRVPTDKNLTDEASEARAKQSASAKRCWQDPQYRARQIATHTGKHLTDEIRAKLSAAAKRRWQDPGYRVKQTTTHTGKHLTAETRAKLSTLPKGNRGKYFTAEARAKISTAHMGKHLTAETRAKISAALKRWHSAEREI